MHATTIKLSTLMSVLILVSCLVSTAAADIGPAREDPCHNKNEGDSCSWLPLSEKKCRWEMFIQGQGEDPELFQRYSGRWKKCEAVPTKNGLLQKRCLSCSDSESELSKDKSENK
jgi:hypothetical protein